MRRLLIVFGIIVLLIVGGYLALSFYAVKFLRAQIQKGVGPGFTIAQIKIRATHLSVRGVRFEEPASKRVFLHIEEVKVYPKIFSLLKRGLQIRECRFINPSLFFHRTPDGTLMGPWIPVVKREKGEESRREEGRKEGQPFRVRIEQIQVLNGSIGFDDAGRRDVTEKFRVKGVDLEVRNIEYPFVSARSPFKLNGKIEGRTKDGKVHSEGWLDIKTTDLEAFFQVREVELRTFEPYYRKNVSTEIESGHVNMDATVAVKGKKIDAPGQIELADLQIGERGTIFYLPATTLSPLLKKRGNRIKAQFHLKGNLDDPGFRLQEVFLTRVAFALGEALGLPVHSLGGSLSLDFGKGGRGLIRGTGPPGKDSREEKGR